MRAEVSCEPPVIRLACDGRAGSHHNNGGADQADRAAGQIPSVGLSAFH